jgi:ectoine hydrolase
MNVPAGVNGVKSVFEPAFSAEEYEARVAATQAKMNERGFDLLLTAEPANLYYLAGYNCWSFYTPQLLAVPASGEVVFFTREVDASGAVLTAHLREDQVVAFPERYVHQVDCHPMDWIAEQMRERGLGTGTIGIELEANYYTVRSHLALAAGLPDATIADAENLVNWVRTVKSPAEIEKMRIAGQIVTRVMTTALDMIEPGVRQCDVVAEIYRAQVRGLEDAGGDYTALVPMLPTGAGTGVPHITWSDKPFVGGEATVLELAACHQRYHSPLARTIFLGEPPKLLTATADIVGEGMEAALGAVRPGVLAEDIEAAWREVITRSGLSKAGRIGYSIGIGYPPDWGERTMSLRPGDKTVLEPGMTFHMILGMWMDGWGYELSESFVVSDEGADCFADVPRGLTVKP